jgi:hypothetical protein
MEFSHAVYFLVTLAGIVIFLSVFHWIKIDFIKFLKKVIKETLLEIEVDKLKEEMIEEMAVAVMEVYEKTTKEIEEKKQKKS